MRLGRPALRWRPFEPSLARGLDATRGGAAFVVCAAHAQFFLLPGLPDVLSDWALRAADLAVMAFFVISGFVVCSSLLRRAAAAGDGRLDLPAFVRARLARLLPPLYAGLALGVLAWAVLNRLDPRYADYLDARELVGVVLFLQTMGLGFDVPLVNGPLWSLAHEFWFYAVATAVAAGLSGRRWAWLAGAVVLGLWTAVGEVPGRWVAGLCVWGAGAGAAVLRCAPRARGASPAAAPAPVLGPASVPVLGGAAAAACIASAVATVAFGLPWARYGFGLALAAGLAAWLAGRDPDGPTRRGPRARGAFGPALAGALAAGGGFSYTLYAVHYPMILVLAPLTAPLRRSPVTSVGVAAAVLVGVTALAAAGARWLEPSVRRRVANARHGETVK